MFDHLLNRIKATLGIPAATLPALSPTVAEQQASTTDPKVVNRLGAFREEWDERETTNELVEGNGGNTDWGMWTEALENEEKSFAPTAPMPITKE